MCRTNDVKGTFVGLSLADEESLEAGAARFPSCGCCDTTLSKMVCVGRWTAARCCEVYGGQNLRYVHACGSKK